MITWTEINVIARERNFSLLMLWKLSQEMKRQCHGAGLDTLTELELGKLIDLHLELRLPGSLGDPSITIEAWAAQVPKETKA